MLSAAKTLLSTNPKNQKAAYSSAGASLKILRWLLFASAFMPLIVTSDYMSPFHFGKVLVFRTLVGVMAIFYLAVIFKDRSYLPRWTGLLTAISLFTLAFGLTAFTGVNIYQSFWGTLERMGGWFSFIHFWVYFTILCSIFKKKEDWIKLLTLSVLAGVLSSFYGLLQKVPPRPTSGEVSQIHDFILRHVVGSGSRAKIFGTVGNPALFAGYVIVNAFFALILAFRPGLSSRKQKYFLAAFLICTLGVLGSGVRGSVIAIILGIALFGFLFASSAGTKWIKKATLIFLGLVAITGILLALFKNTGFVQSNRYLARYSDMSLSSFTVKTRFWAWQAGFDGLNDSFKAVILGYGPENFNIPFSKHFNPKFFRGIGSETLFDRAHNQFIEVLITMGLAGFAAYILIFIFAFKYIRRKEMPGSYDQREMSVFRAGLFSGLVAYTVHNSFIFDTSANYLMFFVLLGVINFLRLESKPRTDPEDHRPILKNRFAAGLLLSVLAIVVIFLFFYSAVTPARANYTTTRAIVASWSDKHDEALEKYKKALIYDTFGSYEIRHRFAQYALEYVSSRKINEANAAKIQLVVDNVEKNLKKPYNDYLPYLYISRAYIIWGKGDPKSEYNDLALQSSFKALEISPTFVRTFYEVAQAYLNKKDYKRAVEYFQRAADLNPEVPLSWWYLGMTKFDADDKKGGLVDIEKALAMGHDVSKSQLDMLRLVAVYLKFEDFAKVAIYYEKLIKLAPKNAQYRASLAVAYQKIGRIDDAVVEAKNAATLDPLYEAEARKFVNSLGREW